MGVLLLVLGVGLAEWMLTALKTKKELLDKAVLYLRIYYLGMPALAIYNFGNGVLSVIKDMGLKDPYVGQTELQTGEIAEDLTYYFAVSEQVPSSVGLGVLMNKDNTVRQAGGFIIQLMPFCDEKVIEKLEQRLAEVNSVTAFLDEGLTPEQILEKLLGDMDLVINDTVPTQFYCNCSRERVSKALIAVGRKELNEMIQEAKPVELKCHFCNSAYEFSTEDLKELLRKSK